MDVDYVLGEALAQLDRLGDVPFGDRARILRQQLQVRGYILQPASAPILNDCSPASLHRTRQALGLTIGRLAQEAGLKEHTVSSAELGTKRPQAATTQAIVQALLRSGARLPEGC